KLTGPGARRHIRPADPLSARGREVRGPASARFRRGLPRREHQCVEVVGDELPGPVQEHWLRQQLRRRLVPSIVLAGRSFLWNEEDRSDPWQVKLERGPTVPDGP